MEDKGKTMIRFKIVHKDGKNARVLALSDYRDIADRVIESLRADYPDANFVLYDDQPGASFRDTMKSIKDNERDVHN